VATCNKKPPPKKPDECNRADALRNRLNDNVVKLAENENAELFGVLGTAADGDDAAASWFSGTNGLTSAQARSIEAFARGATFASYAFAGAEIYFSQPSERAFVVADVAVGVALSTRFGWRGSVAAIGFHYVGGTKAVYNAINRANLMTEFNRAMLSCQGVSVPFKDM
jgi:hypothetical protein